MKAGEVIDKARFTLSDTDKTRWSDERLLSLLDDALLDVALTTRIYNSVGYLQFRSNISVYDASSFAVKIERVEHLNKPLDIVTFNEMDNMFGSGWQETTSETPSHIVYDLKRSGEFCVYPIPIKGLNDLVSSNSDYGILTSLSYESAVLDVSGDYGDLAPPNLGEYLKLYYISAPKELSNVDDDLETFITRSMLSSLAHYVVGAALRDNMDVQNRQVGNEELSFYSSKKSQFMDQKITGAVKRVRLTEYRGMG